MPIDQTNMPVDGTNPEDQGAADFSGEGVQDPQEPDNTAQYKAQLQELVNAIEDKYRQFNSMKFMADNKNKVDNEDTLKKVFDMMKGKGIDPGDDKAVQAFMANLEQTDQDLYTLFVQTMETLISGDTSDEGDFAVNAQQGEPVGPEMPPTGEGVPMGQTPAPEGEAPAPGGQSPADLQNLLRSVQTVQPSQGQPPMLQ
jgi:hypothetical protein